MLRVDAHTHIFPPDVVRNREAFLTRDEWFSQLYANPNARLTEAEHLLDSMAVAGIDHSVVCGFPWRDPGLCDEHNAYLVDSVTRYPAQLSWLGIVSPAHGQRLEQVTADLITAGAAGVGELNADAQAFWFDAGSTIDPALEVCSNLGKPVMVHTSEPAGHTYPGKGTATPDQLLKVIERFPDLTIVAAHWGGGLPFYELMPEVAKIARNVVYDTAATTYLYDFRVFETVINVVGPQRVLFASDFPVLRQDRLVKRVSSLTWRSEQDAAAVMGANACRVYGIDRQDQEPT